MTTLQQQPLSPNETFAINPEVYNMTSLYEQTKHEYKNIFEFIDKNKAEFTTDVITRFIIYCYFSCFKVETCDEQFKREYLHIILTDLIKHYNNNNNSRKNINQQEFMDFYEKIYKEQITKFCYDFVLNSIIADAYYTLKL